MYANPASPHRAGLAAEASLDASRTRIARQLGCEPRELVLTSGGTEAINLALKGTFWTRSARCRIIISRGEHAATREAAAWLEGQGCAVVRLPLTRSGTVCLDSLADALREPADLVSLIHVSNETGAINPVGEITALIDRLQPNTRLHLDGVQTWGKLAWSYRGCGAAMISGSGHKIGAPKGIGWLIRSHKHRLEPLISGGGQQSGFRSGTENPPLAAALALALEESLATLPEQISQIGRLHAQLRDRLSRLGDKAVILSPPDAAPQILTVAFPGLRGVTLMQALSAEDICVSTGAACSSRRSAVNPVLQAMGCDDQTASCAIRISLAETNTPADIDTVAAAIAAHCQRLQR